MAQAGAELPLLEGLEELQPSLEVTQGGYNRMGPELGSELELASELELQPGLVDNN